VSFWNIIICISWFCNRVSQLPTS